jgi:hypothetical protein
MTFNEGRDDHVMSSVASLRTYDVSEPHARRLRRQCRSKLQARPSTDRPSPGVNGTFFRRVVGPALGGAWCLTYVVEIIRRAAAIYVLRP